MGRNKIFGVVLAAGIAAATVAGCGNSTTHTSANPAQAVNNGFSADFHQSGLQVSISVKSTPSALMSAGSKLTAAQANEILKSQLVISFHSAGSTPLSQSTAGKKGSAVDFALTAGGANLADIRSVNQILYLRLDIPKLASSYNLPAASVATFRQDLSQIATELPAAGDINNGKWISIDVPALLKLIESQTGLSIPSTTVTPAQAKSFITNLFAAFQRSYQVSKGTGGVYVLTVQDKALVTNLSTAFSTLPALSSIPGYSSLSHAANKVPASSVVKVDATVSNGKVTELSLPLNQFPGYKLSGPATVVVDLSSTGAISAPAGATAVNLTQLAHVIGQVTSSSSSSSSSSGG